MTLSARAEKVQIKIMIISGSGHRTFSRSGDMKPLTVVSVEDHLSLFRADV